MHPALAASAMSMSLPKEDSAFAQLLLPAVSPPCVEVRIHQFLSSQHLDQPIQFGLFAKQALSAGDVLTPYGGLLRHRADYSSGRPNSKSHARSIRGDGASLVLDGLPLANMLLRPTPHTAEGLQQLVTAGIEPLLPTAARCSEADVQRFLQSPFGFMANNAPSSSCNVSITYQTVRIAGCSYEVPMLKATRAIKTSEEILSPYRIGGSPSPPPLAADSGLTLVLGMAFVNEGFVSSNKAQSGTSIAVVRDRARLLELKNMGHEIITLNKDNSPDQCAPQPHVHASFSRLAVNQLLPLCQGRGPLRAIYADYIRFPGAYSEAYRSFLKDMLPAMIDKGLVGPATQLIILNKEELFQTGSALSAFTRSTLAAADNPLYAATDRADQQLLGAYTNKTAELPATHPFVCFQQSHQTPSSSAASAHASSSASASSSSSSAHAAAPQHFPPDYLARREHMDLYGWVLFHPDEKRQLVQQWLQWSLQLHASQWELERGDWLQAVATEDNAEGVYQTGEDTGRTLLIDALGAAAYDLKLVAQKLMKSPPGKGKQHEHFDAKTLADAQGCYTVIIYLTAGDSTALPTTPHDPAAERAWFRHGTTAAAKLRSNITLETHHVEPGCALVLTHKVLHNGPRNTTATDRITLFQHWVPQTGSNAVNIPDSDVQRLPLGL